LHRFFSFYLNLIHDNVVLINTNNPSEIFEKMIRIKKGDVIFGISFPRYSVRTLKALEFAKNRGADVITLTDSDNSPMTLYSSCNLLAKSDMASFVDSLVAPLSVVNALIVALSIRKDKEVKETLSLLENIWDEYQVYENDEIDENDEMDVND
jgi:DNA-binding MurR/RpiR family transcriptional regulator